jgi:hypothetical protein
VQHLQCPRFNSFLDHKSSSSSSSSSTTTWRRGRSTRKSLLLRGVHPQFHFTHQQLLRNTALLLRVHRIQAVVVLRDHGNCKLSCLVPLSVFVYCLRLMVCLPKNVDLISPEANREIGHILCKMQHLIVASTRSNHMI